MCFADLWGKLAQRSGRSSVSIYNKDGVNDFVRLISDPTKQICSWTLLGADPKPHTTAVEWKEKAQFEPEPSGNSLYSAIFTTSYARLHLYEAMDSVGEHAIYCDTDSLMYIGENEQPTIPVGNYLGGWELEFDMNDPIVSFVGCACKAYSYQTRSGKTVTRVKGFSLNATNSELINYDSMRRLVRQNRDDVIKTVNPSKITRDRYNYKIYNMEEIKRFSYQNDKRVFNRQFKSVPYGY